MPRARPRLPFAAWLMLLGLVGCTAPNPAYEPPDIDPAEADAGPPPGSRSPEGGQAGAPGSAGGAPDGDAATGRDAGGGGPPPDAATSPPFDAAAPAEPGPDTRAPSSDPDGQQPAPDAAEPPHLPPDAAPEPPDAEPPSPPDALPRPEVVASQDLVAYYPFDDATFTQDRSGNGHHATLRGSLPASHLVAGARGGALRLDGNAYLEVPSSPAFDALRTGFTIAAWINLPSAPSAYATVASRQAGSGTWEHFGLGLYTSRGYVTTDDSRAAFTGGAVPLGRWVHMAGTYDGSTMRIYLNGALVGQAGAVQGPAVDQTPLLIGGNQNGSTVGERLVGLLDELRLYQRALTAAEIGAIVKEP
jgi:hypothetical protein